MAIEKVDETTARETIEQPPVVNEFTVKELLIEKAQLLQAINDWSIQYQEQVGSIKTRIVDIDQKLVEMKALGIKEAIESEIIKAAGAGDVGLDG
jgi:hypothetical protein